MSGFFRRAVAVGLTLAMLWASAPGAQAQLSAGVRAPPVLPPRVFGALTLGNVFVVETGLLVFISGVSLDALVKLRMNLRLRGFQLSPYLGLGGAVLVLTTSQGDVTGLNTQVLVGAETPVVNRISAFVELGAAYGLSFFGNGFTLAGGVGLRFGF